MNTVNYDADYTTDETKTEALFAIFLTITELYVSGRKLARKLPFQNSGKGYRDCLIWETIKLELQDMPLERVEIAFITDNYKDFAENNMLAPDLAIEIPSANKIKLFRSVKEFNDEKLLPKISLKKHVEKKLREKNLEEFSVNEWVTKNLPKAINDSAKKEQLLYYFNLPLNPVYINVIKIESTNDIEIDSVKPLTSRDIFINLTLNVVIQIRVDVTMMDYDKFDAVRLYAGDKMEGLFLFKYETLLATVGMAIIVSPKTQKILSFEVDRIIPHKMEQNC